MSIMTYFPYEEPRDSQTDVLQSLEKNWNRYDVFVTRVPVAGGKSAIGTTVQDFSLTNKTSAAITVPNNMLRDQYLNEFDWLCTLKKQDDYFLPRFNMTVKQFMTKHKIKFGPRGCEYNEDYKKARRVGTPIVMNYMGYQAHKLFRNVLIIDEAHQMLNTLKDIHATKIWQHKVFYPDSARTVEDLLVWLEGLGSVTGVLAKLKAEIMSLTPSTTITFTEDLYRGEMEPCIKITPMDVSLEAPIFWPPKTKKIILMSATISDTDIDNMGLGDRKVLYIDAQSEIPEKRRPIYYNPVGSMSMRNKSKTMPQMVSEIKDIVATHQGKKGFIHATYELAELLRHEFREDSRFIFHNRTNKRERFEHYLSLGGDSGAVFVGSGMAEGIDLKYEAGAFQIITKIPFQSLVSPSNRFLAANKPREYIWQTTKEILQASGRICRTPTDYGETHILDSDYDLWFERATKYGQVPAWFNPKEK